MTEQWEPMTSDFDTYQDFSMSRAGSDLGERDRLILAGLGMAGEAGEVADLVKKAIYHNAPLDREKLILEAGDVLWYVAYLADALGVPLSRIAEANREKLLRRYPNGFSAQDAQRRLDEVPK